jgi:hypothetical protein
MNKDKYKKIIKFIKKHGFNFINAKDWYKHKSRKRNIILRHDIDFSLDLACKISEINFNQQIKSNFFIMLRNDFYDPFSPFGANLIKKMIDHKSNIGIHVNTEIYLKESQPIKKIKNDIKYFENFFGIKVDCISYHMPSIFDFKKVNINSKFNSYNNNVMKYYNYISDSSGYFNYTKFEDLISMDDSIQLLIHPIWWMTNGLNHESKINEVYKGIINAYSKNFKKYEKIRRVSFKHRSQKY